MACPTSRASACKTRTKVSQPFPPRRRRGKGSALSSASLRLCGEVVVLCGEIVLPSPYRLPEGPPVLFQVLRRLGSAQDRALESLFQDEAKGVRLAQFAVLVEHPPHAERPVDRHLHGARRGPIQHARKGLLHGVVGKLQDTVCRS